MRAHREGRDDGFVSVAPLIDRCGGRFADRLDAPVPAEATISALRAAETIGHPLGLASFIDRLAATTGRDPPPQALRTRTERRQIGG